MPEFRYAEGRISESLQFISQEIKEFEQDYINRTKDEYERDRKLQKLMDRTVENILTALIEICGTVLTQEGIAVESYSQILKECSNFLGFSLKEQEKLSKLAFQRDRLAHRYLNFRWEAIRMFVRLKPLILTLLEKILKREERLSCD